jgi:integrase
VRLKYIHQFRDRYGQVRYYFRRDGRRTALPGAPGTLEFMEAYHRASAGFEVPQRASSAAGSVSAVIAAYYQHNAFVAQAASTRATRRRILENFRAEHGALSITGLRANHIAKILSGKTPGMAKQWMNALRGLMRFAVLIGACPTDQTVGLKAPLISSPGHHSWTEDEIARYIARHRIGTRAHLAMGLLLHTAARRGDIVRLGPQHIRNGVLTYVQQKTKRRLEIPVAAELVEIIAASAGGHLTFLTTQAGMPYSAEGFGNLFRQWCNEAGLPHCSAHGLRKAQARRLAEAGCSAPQIAAITGHKTLSEVQRYIEAASQKTLAVAAMRTVART